MSVNPFFNRTYDHVCDVNCARRQAQSASDRSGDGSEAAGVLRAHKWLRAQHDWVSEVFTQQGKQRNGGSGGYDNHLRIGSDGSSDDDGGSLFRPSPMRQGGPMGTPQVRNH